LRGALRGGAGGGSASRGRGVRLPSRGIRSDAGVPVRLDFVLRRLLRPAGCRKLCRRILPSDTIRPRHAGESLHAQGRGGGHHPGGDAAQSHWPSPFRSNAEPDHDSQARVVCGAGCGRCPAGHRPIGVSRTRPRSRHCRIGHGGNPTVLCDVRLQRVERGQLPGRRGQEPRPNATPVPAARHRRGGRAVSGPQSRLRLRGAADRRGIRQRRTGAPTGGRESVRIRNRQRLLRAAGIDVSGHGQRLCHHRSEGVLCDGL